MQYAKPVKLRMRDCMNDEDANIGPAIIGLAIIVAMIWLCILIVKGIIAIVSYIFSVLRMLHPIWLTSTSITKTTYTQVNF